jgi:hypothetical protein
LLIALKQAFGLDLTSIAVLFTALSVGIGFGLQYIAADIASGFILLFERPIRIGDRITIGEDEGDVRSIRRRTTIVYTNDRIAIIVPNSKLVSQSVINWSYGDARARISIPVGVASNSDIDVVRGTLLEGARNDYFEVINHLAHWQPSGNNDDAGNSFAFGHPVSCVIWHGAAIVRDHDARLFCRPGHGVGSTTEIGLMCGYDIEIRNSK